ncbi:class II D-tagatose-bisphosphate aldolase non-catalytic subunit [Pelosinus propionicus]|uniref:Tagatose-1,6-bisphosphate aldolase non-catalytic subunit AgaZ/GatZ n=1 Tax=Pelosinus propionicus DSM 13327 TaxID=1123291 RepID=A0A1I4KB37_9FIRM|nr:class II D-tagatose-bisphosphate aldolase, non-catalytic subunit [Pelosinus propionicus]SFL75706.1 Tagatose-1,6-bisphosphate aldolase non-catalytic subunit AgaZ/GatZ [Pelosinus propionicus DSM 13327]
MQKMSLREVIDKMFVLEEAGHKTTLLGIGPMSRNLIVASLELAKEKDFPILFIASRNQVDAKELGGGYVCGWDQQGFREAIAGIAQEVGFTGLYYLCRDHGGPWQRDNERSSHLPEDTAMELAKKSYLEDLIHGFDLLHIDPTKDPYVVGKSIDMEVVLRRTIHLIAYVEKERKARGLPEIGYEVGTEETNGGLTSQESYERFILQLTRELSARGLPIPVFIVGQTGTLTKLTKNVGEFSYQSSKLLAYTAKKYGVGLKEHNGDYLDDYIILDHPSLSITAMNVAPEFGYIETRAYLELIRLEEKEVENGRLEEKSNLKAVMSRNAVNSGRWKKWLIGDDVHLSVEDIRKDEELMETICEICGHYTYEQEEVKQEMKILYTNMQKLGIDGNRYLIDKLKSSISRYVQCFNLQGLTSKLLR